MRYLEEELKKRKQAGKRIAVAGIAAAFTLSATSCNELIDNVLNYGTTAGVPEAEPSYETVDGEMPSVSQPVITDDSDDIVTEGELVPGEALPEESEISDEVVEMGELPEESEVSEEWEEGEIEVEIMGDMAPGYYE